MATDPKLLESVERYLPSSEKILGAFIAGRGAQPGTEALALVIFGVSLLLVPFPIVAWILSGAFFLRVALRRSWVTVVRTQKRVVMIETGKRRRLREGAQVVSLPIESISAPTPATQDGVNVAGEYFWLLGLHSYEAHRLSQLPTTLEAGP